MEQELQKRRGSKDATMGEEFYRFCKEVLPKDEKYKEGIFMVSLFYYFLEKNKLE